MICGTVIIQTDSFANKDCKEGTMERVIDSNLAACLESIVQFLKGGCCDLAESFVVSLTTNICVIFHVI